MAGRVAYLVEARGVPPASILAITFTTAAAATLRERLAAILGADAQDLTITTFHALGLRLIKQWGRELGFGDAVPAVYGRDDARALLREMARDFGLQIAPENGGRDSDPWSVSVSRLAFALDRFRLGFGGAHGNLLESDDIDDELLVSMSAAYEALLQRRGAVDYPFMLKLPLRLFETEPRALRLIQDAYRFVMADEFQDTCHTQFTLLRQVVERHHNLAVVGDPAQACFEWRGATPGILLDFPREYPDAQVFALNQNYRSTGVIVALSNALAAPLETGRDSWTTNAHGPQARVYAASDELDEARFIAGQIGDLLASGQIEHPGEVAVLFRTNAQARTLALALRAAGVPFRVRHDADLFAQPEVRDVVAYLRLAHSPTDAPAFARVLNVPPRKLRVIEQAFRKRPVPPADLPVWAQRRGGPSARRAVEEFIALLNDLQETTRERPPVEAFETVIERTAYDSWVGTHKDGPPKLQRLQELRSVMEASSAPDLATWLLDMHIGDVDGVAPNSKEVVSSPRSMLPRDLNGRSCSSSASRMAYCRTSKPPRPAKIPPQNTSRSARTVPRRFRQR